MKLAKLILLSVAVSGTVAAQDIKIVGTLPQNLTLSNSKNISAAAPKTKHISLLKIELSDNARLYLTENAKHALAHTKQFSIDSGFQGSRLPEKVELGMSNVPVLDQGWHGTCVTFATTAAIDAAINKGDYISQLCQLQLGNYLEKNAYAISGWDGSYARLVFSQTDTFGFVNKEQQKIHGCGGLTEYPLTDWEKPESFMTPEEFHQIAEEVNAYNSPILDIFQSTFDRVDPNNTLHEVKISLKAGDRLTFGILLWDIDLGMAGAIGSYKKTNDTWVLTDQIARDVHIRPNVFGGHEMVITGYDDNAVALDDEGGAHKGLLTLRNSWGNDVGNQGDFYISYDYFKMFVMEVQRIRANL